MGEELILAAKIIQSALLCGLAVLLWQLYDSLLLKPKRLTSKLRKQGISGPSTSFLLGNLPDIKRIKLSFQAAAATTTPADHNPNGVHVAHDWPSKVFAFLEQWRNEYGPTFLFSLGNMQLLCITDPEIVKEIGLHTSFGLGKPSYLTKERGALLGRGITSSSGPLWAHQRKIIAPEFYIEKVKGMMNLMVESTNATIRSWERRIENEGGIADITIDKDLISLTADVISKACFGSDYSQGEEIFSKLRTLADVLSKRPLGIPGLRFLPSKTNREIRKLEKEINYMIRNVVKQRMGTTSEKDLLQMLIEGAKDSGDYNGVSSALSPDEFILDNCKNIYIAGHETVALTAIWGLTLLAAHPEWQARCRAEVLEICKDGLLDADMLRNMKTLGMVIQETLRLYPALPLVTRTALQDIKLKDILIPKGMDLWIPIAMLQQQPDLWGPDAHQFNPERFAHGALAASKFPQAFMPFGLGARICAGQPLAMTELKVIFSLMLSKFSFSLSTTYQHAPTFGVLLVPEHGVCLQVRKA